MMIRRTFLGGKQNLDADERLLPDGEYRKALNIRIANSEGSDVGAIEKSYSNSLKTSLVLGTNPHQIFKYEDEFEEKIYYGIKSDAGCYVVEFTVATETAVFVLQDTRIGDLNALNFNENKIVTGINLVIDSDNGNRLLLFTDDYTQPKCVNIERAKTYGVNGFTEEEILVIKKPPINAPTIVLSDTGAEENNIKEKFIRFSHRYKYLDGEYSALSLLSEVAFKSKSFNYDYATGINESMVNTFNKVAITFNTGSKMVTDIEIVFKESGSSTVYLIETFNKAHKAITDGWANNTDVSFEFTNNKIYRVLPEKQLTRLYDNVPLLAGAQEVIKNRVVYGNYTENYDLADCQGTKIDIDFLVEKVSTAITSGVATRSLKTNRDYEIGKVYLDGYGRMTTPQTSETNTIYIPNSDSINKNEIKVTVNHKAPCFAKYYRFFIKQTKVDYEIITPNTFYIEGVYVWIKIESKDIDKVKEGGSLVIKVDALGVVSTLRYTEVLEVKKQERNFLEDDAELELKQSPGLYFKVKPDNFNLDADDFITHYAKATATTKASFSQNPMYSGAADCIEKVIYYGIDGLNDLTASGVYNVVNIDYRYEVKIFSIGDGATTFDTFQFRKQSTDVWDDNTGLGYAITATAAQAVENGLEITFDFDFGHNIDDEWIVSCKSKDDDNFLVDDEVDDYPRRAYVAYKAIDGDLIYANAKISIEYYESGEETINVSETYTASKNYANLEEWWYGDNIGLDITDIPSVNIWFRRGVITYFNTTQTYFAQDPLGLMTMVIRSKGIQNNSIDGRANITAIVTISQSEQPVLFETKPIDYNTDIYYEIDRTYEIDANKNHLGFDGNDTDQTDAVSAELLLPTFNCFAWGNAHESYTIKDKFNEKKLHLDTRPSTTVENYQQNRRIASFTWSEVYEQSTNSNGLNEFNLSKINFKDLDDANGSIQKMVSLNTDLDVYTEDKVLKVLFEKTLIHNLDGSSNLAKSTRLMDGVIAYAGEFGIGKNPESLVVYGNYTYWADAKRGVVLRKGRSGIEIISNFGMRDWFRDIFREGDTTRIIGGYDPYFGQYLISLDNNTVSFDEKVKGWTSFHSYIPDTFARINNRLFTIKNGQVWLHNEPGFNNFYGVQYTSTIETIFNDVSNQDKIYKTLVLESVLPWKATLTTNLANTTIKLSEFNKRESRWFAYIRQNEDTSNLQGVAQGIGNITAIDAQVISFNEISQITSIGDDLYQLDGSTKELIGTITNITANTLTVATYTNAPTVGLFCFSKKDPRIEGASIRGYAMNVLLEDASTEANELFAINSNAVKSYL